jgi:hypothetical protein
MRRLRQLGHFASMAVRVLKEIARAGKRTRRPPVRRAPEDAPQAHATAPVGAMTQQPKVENRTAEDLGIHLPGPSIWPIVLALGITLILFGVVTDLLFSALGGLIIVGSLGGWIGELRHE